MIAIRCDGISKQYRIGEPERYRALRDVIADVAAAPFRHLRTNLPRNGNGSSIKNQKSAIDNHIWALDDVSFEIKAGEVVGIIGRNGAGKSTLLKILSRITRPTRGHADINGRVGSLLEVGTGFHPELTGRENIFLNGAILGMRKTEIEQKFDEIVSFAEIEKFVDTPVKRYSSGMYVRLAFAVAAHMETEVLVVDEVLAVGDAEFQKKCLGKMDDVTRHGRTVVLVSHQMNQIRKLSSSVIWLDKGRLQLVGPAAEVVSSYEVNASMQSTTPSPNSGFLSWYLNEGGNVITDGLSPASLVLSIRLYEEVNDAHLGVHILDQENAMLASWGFDGLTLPSGVVDLKLGIPALPLSPGVYTLAASLFKDGNNLTGGRLVDRWQAHPSLIVQAREVSHPQDEWSGVLNLPAKLETVSR